MRRKDVVEALRRMGAPPIYSSDGPTAITLTLAGGKVLCISERDGVYLVRTGRTPFCRRYRIPRSEVLVK